MRYEQLTVRLNGKGVVRRNIVAGAEITGPRRLVARADQFIMSKIDARNGALGIVPDKHDGAVVSSDFPVFDVNRSRLLPAYLGWLSKTRDFVAQCRAASEGTTNRVRLREDRFLRLAIPLPTQRRIVGYLDRLQAMVDALKRLQAETAAELDALLPAVLDAAFRGAL